jgi:two-component system sensor histidine kinase YesM
MKKIKGKLARLYKNLSIKRKILLIFYIQVTIPLILIGFVSYKISSDIIYKKSVAYTQNILHTIELRLNDYVNNLIMVSQDFLYDKKIYDVISNNNAELSPLIEYENETEINNTLKKIVFARQEIQSICLISSNGEFYSADNNSRKISIKEAIRDVKEDIHIKARSNMGKAVWYVEAKDKLAENIYFARTIYNKDNFKEIGLMVIMFKKDHLHTLFNDLSTVDIPKIAVVSSENELIASRDQSIDYIFEPEIRNHITESRGAFIDKKEEALVSYVSMQEPSWRIITYVSLNQLYREINILRNWIIILSIISVSLLSVFGLLISFDLISPINRLVKGMKKIQKGQWVVNMDEDRGDELGFLSKTFNEMTKEIDYLVNRIYREQLTRKDAEIKALQSQINPHFLFNTLESINWMAQLNNVPEISETVSALSSLMEVSIGRDDRLITIEEEFSYIDNYILILKKRFEDRITLEKNIQKEVLDVKIPRLLIQPLIENAVYHGLERSRNKGVIRLNARISGQDVLIEVIDNGLGIEKEELDRINHKLSMDNETYFRGMDKRRRKSIGIENVNRRIKLLYGEEYTLRLESVPGEYTKVIVHIPYSKSDSGRDPGVQSNDYR